MISCVAVKPKAKPLQKMKTEKGEGALWGNGRTYDTEDFMQKKFEVIKAKVYPLGVCFQQSGMHIAAVCRMSEGGQKAEEFGVILYDRRHRDGVKIPFPKESRVGSVYAMLLKGYHDKTCSYLFYCGERIWQDPYCKKIENSYKYGVVKDTLPRCMAPDESYDWGDDQTLGFSYENMILYALHVRGFTKHRSSGVKCKGTYQGIVEKIPYLKELGITSLLLMPAYEFDEIMEQDNAACMMTLEQAAASYKQLPAQAETVSSKEPGQTEAKNWKVNYWGYQKGLYYIPKSGYAYGKDAVTEYKDMVKALHGNGIEVLMQFYFPKEITPTDMVEILKYWVLEYHMDGFHVLGMDLPVDMFAMDPLLSDTKILTTQSYHPDSGDSMRKKRLVGWLSESFMYDMRRVLKSDENMINSLIFHMRNNSAEAGVINYIAKWEGMRLMDLVSYDRKHNEQNGEDNQDGTDYNCSWNCGVEGKSRRRNITDLRLRQMKNALSLVFLSQGTPLLYSGDEFGNTQEGNNNPYCQDNAIAWVKWNQAKESGQLLEYTKMLIKLRRSHPILHSGFMLRGMDYLPCGYPDISFHGREAWRPDTGPSSRVIGILYCGQYGEICERKDDALFYIGINLHWKPHHLGLPQPPKGKGWVLYSSTDSEKNPVETGTKEAVEALQEICVGPRTIVIYMAK